MSSYYNKGVVNRYWKRPKPRVYECNVRDAERFYQQSYKDYLSSKETAARKASADRLRSGDEYLSSIGYKRSNSLLDSYPDYMNNDIFSSLTNDSNTMKDSSFKKSYSQMKSPDFDSEIDENLQRIQRLRSELGLPKETSSNSSKVRFQSPSNDNDSFQSYSLKSKQMSPQPRSRRGNTVDISENYSYNSQSNGISKPFDLNTDDFESKISIGKGKTSRFRQGSSFANGDDYDAPESTYKFSGRNGRDSSYSNDDFDKYSYKSSIKSNKRTDFSKDFDESFRKPPTGLKKDYESKTFKSSSKFSDTSMNDIDDYDDDELLSNIKKKFPTSDEILERIKKMDSDLE